MRSVGKIMISVALVAGVSACANSEQASTQQSTAPVPPASSEAPSEAPSEPQAPSESQAPGASAPSGPECTADDVKVTGAVGSKPEFTIPTTCAPPTALVSKDITPGGGPAVAAGSTASMHYVLKSWSDQVEQDSSWKRNEPYPLENVGQASVIDGWNEGLIGLKEGGRRLLIVPPAKGYGPQPKGGMKGNETLVFVIDAVKVT
ncbi:MAG: FKBP-type peptidyl-prolyl cis-trans isomerase [Actinomycetota bacterium]|nr:FKBP-type peptidyl-prolyl cis-trans isomerase [Actinomycetota bacterium]